MKNAVLDFGATEGVLGACSWDVERGGGDGLTLEDESGGDDTDTETDSGLDNDVREALVPLCHSGGKKKNK
jgi:hypothetical protein